MLRREPSRRQVARDSPTRHADRHQLVEDARAIRRATAGLPGDSRRRRLDFAPSRVGTHREFHTARRVRTCDRSAEPRSADQRAQQGGAETTRREHRGLRRGLPEGGGATAEGRGMSAQDAAPTIWTTGLTEVFKTGTWRAALPQHIHAPSPCHAACPVNGDIAEWIGRARAHDFRGAWEILTRHNPFPAVAGRICHHPCEAACNRAGFDESLAICGLERYVGDRALAEGWAFAAIA